MPALLVQNIIDVTETTTRYQVTLPHLRSLKDEVEAAAMARSSYSTSTPIVLSVGHISSIARYLSFYTNVALGRTLGIVFNVFIKLCDATFE